MLLRKPSLGGFGRLALAEVAHLDVPVPVAEVGKTLRLGETASTVAEPPRCVREGPLPVADQATPKRQCEKRQHADGRPGSSSRFTVNEMDAGTGGLGQGQDLPCGHQRDHRAIGSPRPGPWT